MKNKLPRLIALLLFAVISLSSCDKSFDPYIEVDGISFQDFRLHKEFACGITSPEQVEPMDDSDLDDPERTVPKATYVVVRGEKRIFDIDDFGLYIYCGALYTASSSVRSFGWGKGYGRFNAKIEIKFPNGNSYETLQIPVCPKLDVDFYDDFAVKSHYLHHRHFVSSLKDFEQAPIYVEISKDLYTHDEGYLGSIDVSFNIYGCIRGTYNEECIFENTKTLYYYVTEGRIIIYNYDYNCYI